MADSKPKIVKAKWVAPYEASLPDGTLLIPGESVIELPEGEAQSSENWQPVGGSTSKKGDD